MTYKSEAAVTWAAKYGNGLNEYDECILHRLVKARRRRKICRNMFCDYLEALRRGWSVECRDHMGNSVLDAAVDCYRFDEFRHRILCVLLRERPSYGILVKTLGNILSMYGHIGSVWLDMAILSCIYRLGSIANEDCAYLLRRALHGAAWPYLVPLWEGAGLPDRETLNWEEELALYMDDRRVGKGSFFSLPPLRHDFSLLGFTTGSEGILALFSSMEEPGVQKQVRHALFRTRRHIAGGLKKRATKNTLISRDVEVLMKLFISSNGR